MIECYTCGKFGRPIGDRFQAGHCISGRTNAVLFEENLVRVQCVGCNMFGGGKYHIFIVKLIDEIGIKKFKRIVFESKKTVKYTVQDYLDIAEKYHQKLLDLNR